MAVGVVDSAIIVAEAVARPDTEYWFLIKRYDTGGHGPVIGTFRV